LVSVGLLFFSAGFQATGANIWIAWISDLIPMQIRGRFFSRRNQILLAIGLVFSYIVSFHVDLFESSTAGWKAVYRSLLHAESFFVPQNQALFLAFVFVFASILGSSDYPFWLYSRTNAGEEGEGKPASGFQSSSERQELPSAAGFWGMVDAGNRSGEPLLESGYAEETGNELV
jgi:hypothetical protein